MFLSGSKYITDHIWNDLYALPWDLVFYHYQRLDTLYFNTSRTIHVLDNEKILGVTDLSTAENHGHRGDASPGGQHFYSTFSTGLGRVHSSQQRSHINFTDSITISDGTIFFIIDHDDTVNNQRFLKETTVATGLVKDSNTQFRINNLAPESELTFTISTLGSGTQAILITMETDGSDTTCNFYVNSSTPEDTQSTSNPTDATFTAVGNTTASGVSIIEGLYCVGFSSSVFSSAQIGDLMDIVPDIVGVGGQRWG